MPDLVNAADEAAKASYLSCGSVTSTGRGVQLRVAWRTAVRHRSGHRHDRHHVPAIARNAAPRIGSSRATSVRRLPGIRVTMRAVVSMPCRRAEPRRVAAIRAALQHRMADECRRQAMAGEECRLERQQAEQLVPEPGIMPHPAFAPGPDLRRHVVDALDAKRPDRLQHAQGEAGAVDRHHHIGPARCDIGDRLAQPAPQMGRVAAAPPAGPSGRGPASGTGWRPPAPPSPRRRCRRSRVPAGAREVPRSAGRQARRRSPRRRSGRSGAPTPAHARRAG